MRNEVSSTKWKKPSDNMELSTTTVDHGVSRTCELRASLQQISSVVAEVLRFSQQIDTTTDDQEIERETEPLEPRVGDSRGD